jgi:hypothetical protein
MKKANAIARAWAWFQGAMNDLMGFVQQIPMLAINAFKALELVDIILVPRAFMKVAAVFGDFIGKFISWAGNAVWNLLEIIFAVVAPGALTYIKRTGAALKSILKSPLPFVGNLVKAAKLGFQNFADRFGEHLKAGLIGWLTGSLPSVYIPKAFTLGEIVKFVFSVLGLTWQNVRQKLVKVVGETAVKAMETGFDIVVTLVTQGPAAAWEKIKEQLANLKDMVIGGITDFVIDTVVKKAIPKLVSMFIPGAGFISAIISIYDTIMVFVNKISQIIQVVTGFIDSIVAIAGGVLDAAAKRVESTLANLLSLAISFLAGFIGLGKVADKIMGVINKVRQPIDKALDALINWIVTMAKKLFAKATGRDGSPEEKQRRLDQAITAAKAAVTRFSGKKVGPLVLKPILAGIRLRYGLITLEPVARGKRWAISGAINPSRVDEIPVEVEEELPKKIEQVKADYRAKLDSRGYRDALGRCFDHALSFGLTAVEQGQQLDINLIQINPRQPATEIALEAGRTIQEQFAKRRKDYPKSWTIHYIVTVNGKVYDVESDKQGLTLGDYLKYMFGDQKFAIRIFQKQDIVKAARDVSITSGRVSY